MILYKFIIGIIASGIGIFCFIPYFRDVFLRKTQPHIYTWLIWFLLQGTSVFIILQDGGGIGVLPFAFGAILCASIFLLSFKYGTKNITLSDTTCLVGALIALCVYFFLHNPLLSIVLVSVIDFIGFIPTFRKSYYEPNSETSSTYILSALSSLLAIIALFHYSTMTALYPITLVFTDTTCWLIIFFRRKNVYLKVKTNQKTLVNY